MILKELDQNNLSSNLQSLGKLIMLPRDFKAKPEDLPPRLKGLIIDGIIAISPKKYAAGDIKKMYKIPLDIEKDIGWLKAAKENLNRLQTRYTQGIVHNELVEKAAGGKDAESFLRNKRKIGNNDIKREWVNTHRHNFEKALQNAPNVAQALMKLPNGLAWIKSLVTGINSAKTANDVAAEIDLFYGITGELYRRFDDLINQFDAALPSKDQEKPEAENTVNVGSDMSAKTPAAAQQEPSSPMAPVGDTNHNSTGELFKRLTKPKNPGSTVAFSKDSANSYIGWANKNSMLAKDAPIAEIEDAIRAKMRADKKKAQA